MVAKFLLRSLLVTVFNEKFKPRANELNLSNFCVCNTKLCAMSLPPVCSGGLHSACGPLPEKSLGTVCCEKFHFCESVNHGKHLVEKFLLFLFSHFGVFFLCLPFFVSSLFRTYFSKTVAFR